MIFQTKKPERDIMVTRPGFFMCTHELNTCYL